MMGERGIEDVIMSGITKVMVFIVFVQQISGCVVKLLYVHVLFVVLIDWFERSGDRGDGSVRMRFKIILRHCTCAMTL